MKKGCSDNEGSVDCWDDWLIIKELLRRWSPWRTVGQTQSVGVHDSRLLSSEASRQGDNDTLTSEWTGHLGTSLGNNHQLAQGHRERSGNVPSVTLE